MSEKIENAAGSKLFEGMTGPGYSAFCSRDPYYEEMATLVATEALQANSGIIQGVLELGAGTGVSTRVIRSKTRATVCATEPNESMRHFLALNTMGDPGVRVLQFKAEELTEDNIRVLTEFDCVMCCQMFHLMAGALPAVLSNIHRLLRQSGTITFDLGPSNWSSWRCNIHDFRSGALSDGGQIISELSHPLYQIAHGAAYAYVKEKYLDFTRENLWAPPARALSLEGVSETLNASGFDIIRINEFLVPIDGSRIQEFVRNAWTTWCRWEPLDKLPIDDKIAIVGAGLSALFKAPAHHRSMMAYHPSVIITARKR